MSEISIIYNQLKDYSQDELFSLIRLNGARYSVPKNILKEVDSNPDSSNYSNFSSQFTIFRKDHYNNHKNHDPNAPEYLLKYCIKAIKDYLQNHPRETLHSEDAIIAIALSIASVFPLPTPLIVAAILYVVKYYLNRKLDI